MNVVSDFYNYRMPPSRGRLRSADLPEAVCTVNLKTFDGSRSRQHSGHSATFTQQYNTAARLWSMKRRAERFYKKPLSWVSRNSRFREIFIVIVKTITYTVANIF